MTWQGAFDSGAHGLIGGVLGLIAAVVTWRYRLERLEEKGHRHAGRLHKFRLLIELMHEELCEIKRQLGLPATPLPEHWDDEDQGPKR